MHYVLVDPEYQKNARHCRTSCHGMVKQRYHDYLYIEVMPEESKNATVLRSMRSILWRMASPCRYATGRTALTERASGMS